MSLLIIKIFILLATISYGIPFLVALKLRNRLMKEYKPIFIYTLFNVLFVLLEYVFAYVIKNSNPIHHISSFVMSFLTISYYHTLYLNKKVFTFCVAIMSIIFLVEIVFLDKILELDNLFFTFSNCLVSVISFFHLFKLFDSLNAKVEHFQFQYYISLAFFIYNSTSFFMSLFESQIIKDLDYMFVIVYPIYSTLIIFQNLMFAKGIWFLKKI